MSHSEQDRPSEPDPQQAKDALRAQPISPELALSAYHKAVPAITQLLTSKDTKERQQKVGPKIFGIEVFFRNLFKDDTAVTTYGEFSDRVTEFRQTLKDQETKDILDAGTDAANAFLTLSFAMGDVPGMQVEEAERPDPYKALKGVEIPKEMRLNAITKVAKDIALGAGGETSPQAMSAFKKLSKILDPDSEQPVNTFGEFRQAIEDMLRPMGDRERALVSGYLDIAVEHIGDALAREQIKQQGFGR